MVRSVRHPHPGYYQRAEGDGQQTDAAHKVIAIAQNRRPPAQIPQRHPVLGAQQPDGHRPQEHQHPEGEPQHQAHVQENDDKAP